MGVKNGKRASEEGDNRRRRKTTIKGWNILKIFKMLEKRTIGTTIELLVGLENRRPGRLMDSTSGPIPLIIGAPLPMFSDISLFPVGVRYSVWGGGCFRTYKMNLWSWVVGNHITKPPSQEDWWCQILSYATLLLVLFCRWNLLSLALYGMHVL